MSAAPCDRISLREDLEAAVLAFTQHKMTPLRFLQYTATLMGREFTAIDQIELARWLMQKNKVSHLGGGGKLKEWPK